MTRKTIALIAVLTVIGISTVFVVLGYEMVRTDRNLNIDRAKALGLSIDNFVEKRLSNVTSRLAKDVMRILVETSGRDDAERSLRGLGARDKIIKGFAVVLPGQGGIDEEYLSVNRSLAAESGQVSRAAVYRGKGPYSNETYVVATLRGREYAAVVKLDREEMLLRLKSDLVDFVPPLDAVVTITDRDGKVLAASENADRKYLFESKALRGPFAYWNQAFYLKGDEGGRFIGSRVITNYTKIFALLVLVIVLGIYFAILVITREVETINLQSEFVSSVSHDLKTPLTSIRMYTELLDSGKVKNPKKVREYIRTIHNESVRLSFLVQNVLEMTRASKKERRYSMSPVDLNDVLRDSVAIIGPYARQKGFKFTVRYADNAVVKGDRNALAQVLLNLIDNAIKYSSEVKSITAAVVRKGGRCCLVVSDKGIGIPRLEQGKIFEKFYRVDMSGVREKRGIGLGLAIVRQIMDGHNGSIRVESAPGIGSIFTAEFRRAK